MARATAAKERKLRQQVRAALDTPRWQPGLEGLDWQSRLFVLLYVREGGDSTFAARIAFGGDPKGDAVRGLNMLAQPAVQRAILSTQQRIARDIGLTLDDVIDRISAFASSNMGRLVTVDEAGGVRYDLRAVAEADWRTIKSLSIDVDKAGNPYVKKIEMHDASKALETLGKHLGMGTGTARIIVEHRDEQAKLAKVMGLLTEAEVQQLADIGSHIERIASDSDVIDADHSTVDDSEPVEGSGEPEDP